MLESIGIFCLLLRVKVIDEANMSANKYYSPCAAGTLVAYLVAGVLASILACVWVVKLLQSCQCCPAHATMHKLHLQHKVSLLPSFCTT